MHNDPLFLGNLKNRKQIICPLQCSKKWKKNIDEYFFFVP